MSDIMIFRDVQKNFGDVQALQNVSFTIPGNTIFGLLGPNGAGKTTLIRIITKIFMADSGEVIFDGKNIRNYQHASIGYMPEEKGMYKKMKVGEHLIYLARLKGLTKKVAIEKITYWLEKLNAQEWWNKKIEDLSKGMQQKVQFISTVIHEPKLLILDEPFSGLDPVNAELIKNEIYNLNQQGTTILFSTHRMEQVEEICDSIVLINQGNVVIHGKVKEIKNRFRENKYVIGFENEAVVASSSLFEVINKNENNYIIQLHADAKRNAVLNYFIDAGNEIIHFEELYPSLNDIFIKLVNADNHA
ncbi:MAG: ABC transporter ATP-binding protein [Fimbriimonadaceae bacterium]|nr:ABC transporter ATP-binding protein [Chitinophagales bacterium]